jgi:hypothetical protein
MVQCEQLCNHVRSRHSYRTFCDLEASAFELQDSLPHTSMKQGSELEGVKLKKFTGQFLEARQGDSTPRGLPRHRHRSNPLPTLSSRPKTTAKVLSLSTQTILPVPKEVA